MEIPTPAGMVRASYKEFFAAMGKEDVHPHVDKASLRKRFIRSVWETPTRRVLGESFSDSWGVESTVFFLKPLAK